MVLFHKFYLNKELISKRPRFFFHLTILRKANKKSNIFSNNWVSRILNGWSVILVTLILDILKLCYLIFEYVCQQKWHLMFLICRNSCTDESVSQTLFSKVQISRTHGYSWNFIIWLSIPESSLHLNSTSSNCYLTEKLHIWLIQTKNKGGNIKFSESNCKLTIQ